MSHLPMDYLYVDLFTGVPVYRIIRNWATWGGSYMFVPFRRARSKGVACDGTSLELTFLGGSGREEGWKE